MYSPKIAERLIPPLYRLARARGQRMTTVVNEVLAAYLARHGPDPRASAVSPTMPPRRTAAPAAAALPHRVHATQRAA